MYIYVYIYIYICIYIYIYIYAYIYRTPHRIALVSCTQPREALRWMSGGYPRVWWLRSWSNSLPKVDEILTKLTSPTKVLPW